MDLSSVIASFNTGTYTVTRPAASTFTLGRLDTPSTTTVSIQASVQPLTGRELKKLPEGLRTEELRWVYTATELRSQPTDSIAIDGAAWAVQQVESWGTLGAYFRALVMKTGN